MHPGTHEGTYRHSETVDLVTHSMLQSTTSLSLLACPSIPTTQAGIISPVQQILDLRCLEMMRLLENEATRHSLRLRDIARYTHV